VKKAAALEVGGGTEETPCGCISQMQEGLERLAGAEFSAPGKMF
jgi:hypothetical protein